MRNLVWIGLTLAVSACASAPSPLSGPSQPQPPFVEPQPVRFAAIYGNGAYRTRTGGRGSCAGQSVALMGDTPRFRARIIGLSGSAEHALLPIHVIQTRSAKLGDGGPSPLVQSVQCDPKGVFEFRGLSAGSYFIIARVHQTQIDHTAADYVDLQHVSVRAGESVDVRLAP